MTTEIRISLTLNGETREITARPSSDGRLVIAYGIDMMTTHGAVTHRGNLYLRPREDANYTERDIVGYWYLGMRGNGHGQRSRLRFVGHAQHQAEQGA